MNKMTTAEETNKTAWLGEFPPHWQVLRIKNLFREIDNRSESGAEELLSVSHYTGVTLKRESLENEDDHLTNAESLEGYKLVEPGDLVVNIMLAWNGSMGISPYKGITSPAYCVYRIKEGNNPEYFGYLFTTELFKAEFRRNSTGIIDSRLRLYSDKFFSIFTVVPTKEEQDKIVEFIKAKEEKINLFIEKKKRLIELLKERKMMVINRTVHYGINTIRANFNASKLEYIGNVPQHWEIVRGTALFEIISEPISLNKIKELDVVEYYSIPSVQELNAPTITNAEDIDSNKQIISGNELLVSKLNPRKKTIIISSKSNLPMIASTEFVVLRPKRINIEYAYYLYLSDITTSRISSTVQSATNSHQRAYPSHIYKLWQAIPPPEEQKQIVEHIKKETITIDAAIAKAEREIELVREYKEAMIAEVVMGKRILNFAN